MTIAQAQSKALTTSVPEERPRTTFQTTHGPALCYAPLSEEHRARGEVLRDRRCLLGLPLGAAARKLGISVVVLSECERGAREFDMAEAIKLLGPLV